MAQDAEDPTPVAVIPIDPSMRRATAGDLARLEGKITEHAELYTRMHGEHSRRLERVEGKQDELMTGQQALTLQLVPMNGSLQRLDAHVSKLVRADEADTKVKTEVRKQGWRMLFKTLTAFLAAAAAVLGTLAIEHWLMK